MRRGEGFGCGGGGGGGLDVCVCCLAAGECWPGLGLGVCVWLPGLAAGVVFWAGWGGEGGGVLGLGAGWCHCDVVK